VRSEKLPSAQTQNQKDYLTTYYEIGCLFAQKRHQNLAFFIIAFRYLKVKLIVNGIANDKARLPARKKEV
jgi:hypothetical protein